ncbi:Pullulanase precursor [Clostridiales bacterium CHKCI001]|nr:Pullulanase precursor [Clostridiales bacterium CHKCI001]
MQKKGSSIFSTKEFHKKYSYSGKLGANYTKESTMFTVWAPTAEKVELVLYGKNPYRNERELSVPEQVLPMERGQNGTWKMNLNGDWDGTFYNYRVTVDTVKEAVDPYAKAVGVNGMVGMVVDLSSTNPNGWELDKKPELDAPTDAIIYEMHVRDFSIAENSGVEKEKNGKFTGVWQPGTKIPGINIATCLDHLKELGVTMVHLLPVFDYDSVDESKPDTPQFNWGYDPQNYNAPEGSYSSNPYDGKTRIKEMKQMIMELHKAGIRVIMDVVFNHTAKTEDSNFNKIVPNYYYRQDKDGNFSDASACGNETASERYMVQRFITDSVVYWAEEYHIDGFRFDLMAVHDIETMKEVRRRVDTIDPQILIYGEGWNGGPSPLPKYRQALKVNTVQYGGLQIAAFSDDIRDGVKGSVFKLKNPGFVNGGKNWEENIKFGIVASIGHEDIDYAKVYKKIKPWANEPYQTITYASAHDNLTLWDKLQMTNPNEDEDVLVAMNKLCAAIILTSQGIAFMQAGEEMARTKVKDDGTLDENSYASPDSVNQIDWQRKIKYKELYEYYRGLIQIRKAHKMFHMNTAQQVRSSIHFIETGYKNVVAYFLDGQIVQDLWKEAIIIFNGNRENISIQLPEGSWNVVVNEEKAGIDCLRKVNGCIQVPPISAYVLVKVD